MEKHLFVISLDALGALDLKDTTDFARFTGIN